MRSARSSRATPRGAVSLAACPIEAETCAKGVLQPDRYSGVDAAQRKSEAAAASPSMTTRKETSMESLISLRYPNGRTHEASLTTPRELKPGDRFELHGRHWQAIESKLRYGRRVLSTKEDAARVLCVTSDTRA